MDKICHATDLSSDRITDRDASVGALGLALGVAVRMTQTSVVQKVLPRIAFTVMLACLALPVNGENLWVRPKGSFQCSGDCSGTTFADAFDGTARVAWGEGAGRVGAGDTLWVCGDFDRSVEGTVDVLDVQASGTSGAPIVIDGACSSVNAAYPDGRIWAARRIDKSEWRPAGNGAYVVPWGWVHEYSAEGSFEQERLLVTASNLADCVNTPGSIFVDTNARLIYYRPTAAPDTVWSNWASAIDVRGNDFVTIQNLVLRGGTGGEHGVVKLTGKQGLGRATNIAIRNSDIAFAVTQLIECYEGCDDVIIEGNRLHDAPSATYLCRGPVSCSRIVIRNNEVFSGRDVANVYYQSAPDRQALGGQSLNHSLIEGNYIHDWAGDGIHIWVGPNKDGRRNVIRYNRIERLWDEQGAYWHNGIMLAGTNEINKAELTEGWKIYGNVIVDLSGGKPTNEAAAIRVKAPFAGSFEPVEVFNNTVMRAHVGIWIRENALVQGLSAKVHNNIVITDEPGAEYVRVGNTGDNNFYDLRFDNNIYFGSGVFTYRGRVVATLGDWQNRLGTCAKADSDCASMLTDPLLTGDGTPYANSPAINAGRRLHSQHRFSLKENARLPNPSLLDQDQHGPNWEIGAYVMEQGAVKPAAPTDVRVD